MSQTLPLRGQALVLGHDVNTDELHPSSFYSLDDDRVRAGFLGAVPGKEAGGVAPRIVVAGRNFGCGSSRETGARVFKLAGVQAVVAASFARIFERNLVNLGLPVFTCPALAEGIPEAITDGLLLYIQDDTLVAGALRLALHPPDPLHQAILAAGGLLPYLGIAP